MIENTFIKSEGFIKELALSANSFGFRSKEFVQKLRKSPIKTEILQIMASVCCYFAYLWSWETVNCDGRHWDERNKASKAFCYANSAFWEKLYKDLVGEEFPINNPEYKNFFQDITDKKWKFKEEIREFSNTHHTIQQRIICAFYEYFAEEYPDYEFIPGPGYSYIVFPFI